MTLWDLQPLGTGPIGLAVFPANPVRLAPTAPARYNSHGMAIRPRGFDVQKAAVPWDGVSIGAGPIALAANPETRTDGLHVVAGSLTHLDIVCFKPERLGEFVQRHLEALFVSRDVATLHWCLHDHLRKWNGESALNALWALVQKARWVDVRHLDRQVRHAGGDEVVRPRDLQELTGRGSQSFQQKRLQTPGRGAKEGAFGNTVDPERAEIRSVLEVFTRLRADAERLEVEARPIPPPPYVVREPKETELEGARHATRVRAITEHRQQTAGAASWPVGADHNPDAWLSLEQGNRSASRSAVSLGVIGHGVEVFAAVALAQDRHPGFTVDRVRLPEFLLRVEHEYRAASAVLARDRPRAGDAKAREGRLVTASECFAWSEDRVRLNDRGFPVTEDKNLGKWLRQRDKDLCDAQHQRATIPRKADGEPSLNPEEWGIWAACDRYLWAWRQVYRMAELGRIADADASVRPRFETLPTLRSREPNLVAYRYLGVPLFRPREGHVFVAGRLDSLRACCLATVCLDRGYVAKGSGRLYHYVLREKNPLAVAAAELYVQNAILEAGTRAVVPEAEKEFLDWEEAGAHEYYYWLGLANTLLETAPLGLPNEFLTRLLQLEYGLEDLTESEVLRLQRVLADGVAYEVRGFQEDATFDLVTARLGLTVNDGLRRFIDIEHPEASGAALRNALSRRRGRMPVNKILKQGSLAEQGQALTSTSPPCRRGLFKCRGASLAGRVTLMAASVAVRREEVLLSADDVMLSVAHALVAAGYRLLGIAGSEFVLEVPAIYAIEEELRRIGSLVQEASRLVLRHLTAPVRIDFDQSW